MTPMAAPCQIMVIEPGGYTLKDYLKMWYTSGSDSCDYDDFFNAVDVSVLLRDRKIKEKQGS